ncbi:hypothetical protein [Polaribacter porphyrae]|uniref:Uncharacterized protein n=1 Tax=Polaribacter porphyrae TaxID=1137780 RepID=A0A2S7WK67_9FLAO|nr:hypothetical protein [Polaribacter porphyrae]PQJ78000.1 hypothetical protein BTO18_01820 [Polaribacter porphyrae]
MKKGVLILLGMFMMVSTVEAKKGEKRLNRFGVNYYSYNNAVNFFERGIEFFVFTNGDFDFDTSFTNRGVRINRDFRGRIRSVGNVFINYDRRGNVTRIGNIFIRYRRGVLTNVGDLRVRYDRWDNPIFYGNVRDFYYHNGVRFNINFGDVCDYNDAYFFRNDFRRNYTQFREDRNFYYYRANPNARIGKRSTIIKRRKANVVRNNDRNVRNTTRNTYRKSNSNGVNSRRNVDTNSRRKVVSKKSDTKTKERVSTKRNTRSSYRKSDVNKSKDKNVKRGSRTRRN